MAMNWSSAIAMATPISHKGAVAGARVVARTTLELMMDPSLIPASWAYFNDVQNKDQSYVSFLGAEDPPPIELNQAIQDGRYTKLTHTFAAGFRDFYPEDWLWNVRSF